MFSSTRIVDLLCCPKCRGPLTIEVTSEDELGIRGGSLACRHCRQAYAISEGIFHLPPGDEVTKETGDWDLSCFEDLYRCKGGTRSNVEWAENTGVPRPIAEHDHPRVKGRLMDWLDVPDNGTVLDVGAGSGYFIFEIMRHCTAENVGFVGIDPSAEHIKWLEDRKREEGRHNILTVVGDGRALPFQQHRFDAVICSEVLEHIPANQRVIQAMAACLRPGGMLLLSTPSKAAFDFWDFVSAPLRWALRTRKAGNPYDRPMHARELKRYLGDAGIRIEHFEMNVILPPQSYFAHVPRLFARVCAGFCALLERHMKWLLASRFALHMVVCGRKTGPDMGGQVDSSV